MIHLNDNLLCAIDIRVSGQKPMHHDLVQITIMPLNSFIEPDKSKLPFHVDIIPKHPGRIVPETSLYAQFETRHHIANKHEIERITKEGIEAWDAVAMFDTWMEKLQLPRNKRIMPLSFNWSESALYIADWLGGMYNLQGIFDYRSRDLVTSGLFLNDYYFHNIRRPPLPKVYLQYLCSQLKIDRKQPTDTLEDCTHIAEIYRRMLTNSILYMTPENELRSAE